MTVHGGVLRRITIHITIRTCAICIGIPSSNVVWVNAPICESKARRRWWPVENSSIMLWSLRLVLLLLPPGRCITPEGIAIIVIFFDHVNTAVVYSYRHGRLLFTIILFSPCADSHNFRSVTTQIYFCFFLMGKLSCVVLVSRPLRSDGISTGYFSHNNANRRMHTELCTL